MTFLTGLKKIANQKALIRFIVPGFLIFTSSCLISSSILAANTKAPSQNSIPTKHGETQSGKLTFYFQNIELRALLQLIAKNSGLNFIISETVKGNTTVNLKDVTWQQALDIVLQSHGLGSKRLDNVILISSIEEITSNEARQLQSQETLSNLAPLTSSIIHLKYTNATDLATLLKGAQNSLLTPRGQVAVDSRTNSIIVRDIKSNIADITRTIKQLDVPARQVLIEARIVNIDINFEEQIGARFGVSKSHYLSGSFAGANSLAQGTDYPFVATPGGVIDPTQRLNFNLPARALSIDSANPASLGLAVAKIGGVFLDLELSALEGEDHAEIISRPRVITSNQQKAIIQTGEEIPYQESTSSGATSVSFKKAVLSLEIVPQITPDNKIILTLKATQDSRGVQTALTAGTASTPPTLGPPSINTQEVQSNILLNNNETVVVGGIYRQTKQNTVERIPFLGSIPILGALFSHHGTKDQKTELLVFITPKIVGTVPPLPLHGELQDEIG
jgi:type IV pilus assembly protein PilQ